MKQNIDIYEENTNIKSEFCDKIFYQPKKTNATIIARDREEQINIKIEFVLGNVDIST